MSRGLFQTIGYDSDVAQTYVNSLARLVQSWDSFFNKRRDLFRKFRDTDTLTWKDLQNQLSDMYAETAKIEVDQQTNMMNALANIYQESLGRPASEIKYLTDAIVAARKDISSSILEFRKSLANTNLSRKATLEAYNNFNVGLKKKIQDLQTLVQNGLYEIKEGRVQPANEGVQPEPTQPTRTEPTQTEPTAVEPEQAQETQTTQEAEETPLAEIPVEEIAVEETPAQRAVTAKEAYDNAMKLSRQNLTEAYKKSLGIMSKEQVEAKIRDATAHMGLSEEQYGSYLSLIHI